MAGQVVERKSKWGKVGKVSVIFFTILACIAGIAYTQSDIPGPASTYEKNREAARSAGLCFDHDAVAALYSVPDDQNAATILQPSLEKLNDYEVANKLVKLSDSEFLKKWQEMVPDFEKIELGCQRHRLILKHPGQDVAEGTQNFGSFKNWTLLMMRRLRLAVATNNIDLAKRLILTCSKLSVLIDDEPDVIAILVRVKCAAMVELALRDLIVQRGTELRWQELILQAVQILDQPYDLKPFLRRIHWWAMHEFDAWAKGQSEGIGSSAKQLCLIPRYRTALFSRIHEFYAQALTTYPADLYDFASLQKQSNELEAYKSQEGLVMFFAAILLQNFPGVELAFQIEITNRSVIMQAIHILHDHRDPAQGLPLSGRYALDLDGGHLRIKKKDGHWIVYSVGKDKVDDGGVEASKTTKGDFVVHLSPTTVWLKPSLKGGHSK